MKYSKKKFLNEATLKAGFHNNEVVQRSYDGMVKAIIKGLKEDGIVYLPNIGTFKILTYKQKNLYGFNTSTRIIKFSACENLKYYIKNMKTRLDNIE